jgi:UDP-N-acetylglucosamine 2-epimerase (non-hydrolysing)
MHEIVDIVYDLLRSSGSLECIIVQGDTTSAFAVALAAFYAHRRIAHIEAGLRSGDLRAPWPEEGHRRMIDEISDYLYCPSMKSSMMASSGYLKNQQIVTVGNTALDMIRIYLETHKPDIKPENQVLVTVHRREAINGSISEIFSAINEIALQMRYTTFLWPMHPNPGVQLHRELLTAENIKVVKPMKYGAMIEAILKSSFVMTDSGGLQEEAPYLGRRVVVLRDTTERQEAVANGSCVLGGTNRESILKAFEEVKGSCLYNGESPYGDGHAAKHIVNHLMEVCK